MPGRVKEIDGQSYYVDSASSDATYLVEIMEVDGETSVRCGCRGFAYRSTCHHIEEVARYREWKARRSVAIKKDFIVHLRGKDYPLYAGVLDAATEAGLKALTVKVVQIPTTENGMLAVVTATAVFDDGRVFEDVGDCSPQSTSPHLAAASLRLASTRAKGRVLRDSINVGQTMFEELPDLDQMEPERPRMTAHQREVMSDRPSDQNIKSPPVTAGEGTQSRCASCGCDLTQGQVKVSTNAYGQPLCPQCQKNHVRLDAK